MKLGGHELPEDALDSHKTYLINGDEIWGLIEAELLLNKMGMTGHAEGLNNIIKSALANELEEEDE